MLKNEKMHFVAFLTTFMHNVFSEAEKKKIFIFDIRTSVKESSLADARKSKTPCII
jgi:hypothetical protein